MPEDVGSLFILTMRSVLKSISCLKKISIHTIMNDTETPRGKEKRNCKHDINGVKTLVPAFHTDAL